MPSFCSTQLFDHFKIRGREKDLSTRTSGDLYSSFTVFFVRTISLVEVPVTINPDYTDSSL